MESFFIGWFSNENDVYAQFDLNGQQIVDMAGAKILLAYYGYGSYDGSATVIFEKDGVLYEVNGGHCSCYGLEDQWDPEVTTWAAVAMKDFSNYYDDAEEAQNALLKLTAGKIVELEARNG